MQHYSFSLCIKIGFSVELQYYRFTFAVFFFHERLTVERGQLSSGGRA